jgi:uncharacterized protein YijF (DUF1287 family)
MYTAFADLRMFVLIALVLLQPRGATPPAGVRIATAAATQVGVTTIYDPSYVSLRYPGGDLPPERGVCADVIVRAFRAAVGVDLQREIHEDMRRAFRAYPSMWGLSTPDANIDHRRVPNLMKFFERRGKSVTGDFQPGDIVAWRLPGGLYHIGIIAEDLVPGTSRHYAVHNIGRGAQKEDVLYEFTIIGHYRWV